MNVSFREQLAIFVTANQGAVTGGMLFVVAFSVFAMNATFNQSGNHPLPLWSKTQNIVTNSVTVPVRRVETIRFSPATIPVPRLRPAPPPSTPAQLQHGQSREPAVAVPVAVPVAVSVDGKEIQQLLSRLGFYTGPIDGMIGSQTGTAIRKFERSKFLPESGEISPSLLLLLESTFEAGLRKTSIVSTQSTTPVIQNGIDAAIITRIQVGLINFGISGISIDGVMGSQTSQAIKTFQRKFNMNVTGLASSKLVKKLESVGALTKG